jgi:hypothetical protein
MNKEEQGEIIDLGVATVETKGPDPVGNLDSDHITRKLAGGSGIAED